MIVILLLMIIAVLLFGAAAILKLGGAVLKFAFALLALSLFLAFWRGLDGQGWWLLAAMAAAGVVGIGILWSRGSADENLLASAEGRRLRAEGKSAQETVDELRRQAKRT